MNTLNLLNLLSVSQIAYVTRNIESGAETLKAIYGIPELPFGLSDSETSTGSGTTLLMRAAVAYVNDIHIELISPTGGDDAIYRDFLPDEDGAIRHHHFAQFIDDESQWDETLQQIEKSGLPTPMRGEYYGVQYVYVDTRKITGHYMEFVFANDEGKQILNAAPRYSTKSAVRSFIPQ